MRWAVLIMLLLGGCSSSQQSCTWKPERQTHELIPAPADAAAAVLASYQQAVKAQLKTPATAQFEKPPGIVYMRAIATGLQDNLSAYGTVDAQNLFGALVRNNYWISYTRGPGGWVVASVRVY